MTDRFTRTERRVAIALLVVTALGAVWNTVEELRPPPPPLRLIRGALKADSTDTFDLNGQPEGIVYSSGEPELTGPIDLRTADEETLTLLPGIGPVLARRIAEWRDAREGPWQVDDLLEVSGIGPAKLAQLRPLVVTGPTSAAEAGPDSTEPAGLESTAGAGPDSTGPTAPERPEKGVNGVDHPRGGHYDTARLSRGAHPRKTGAARKQPGLSGGML